MNMKIIEIQIVKTKSESVVARADVHFEGFWMKGFKVMREKETSKEFVTPPSYRAGMYWRPLFRTDDAKDWQEIQRRILEKHNEEQIGETVEDIFK
jgi:hypothetical protein